MMNKERLMVLLKEHSERVIPAQLTEGDASRKDAVEFILKMLGYAWQDGGEIDVITMLKSAVK